MVEKTCATCDRKLDERSIKVKIGSKTIEVCCDECAQKAEGLRYEDEPTTYGRLSPAESASTACRSSVDKRSNRGLVPERGDVGTCERKGKHNDFETRIECGGGI